MPTIPVGSGLSAQIVAKDEMTFGVAASLASGADSFEFKSETLELKKTTVVGEGLAAGHVYQRTKRRVLTNYDVTGDINMELPTRNLGFWLRYMVGDFTETPYTVVSGLYGTVFRPLSSLFGHSFTLQKGVPTADNATVEPFTYAGCKLSGWEMGVSTGAIATLTLHVDGRNELAGAGNGDPLNASVPALATWSPVVTGLGMGVWHFREATLYTGGTPATTPISAPAAPVPTTLTTGGTILAGTYTVEVTYVNQYGETVGSATGTVTTTGSTSTITIPSPTASGGATGWYAYVSQAGGTALTRQQVAGSPTAIGTGLTLSAPPTSTGASPPAINSTGIVSLTGSTAAGNVKDATVGQSYALDANRIFVGANGFKSEQIENGYRQITGSLTVEWLSSESLYNAFSADTTTSLELKFVGPSVGGNTYLLDIIVPNIKLDGESPKVPGPAVITQQVKFVGYDDEATYPLQITYQSEDSTF